MIPFKKLLSNIFRFLLCLISSELSRDFNIVFHFISDTKHADISKNILNALILAEDKRFFFHVGIDPIAIARAIWSFLTKKTLQGASTIEQQLVRTITKRYDLSISRKLREIFLASLISTSFPKEQMARAYLSIAYFGWQMNGIDQACARLLIQPANASPLDAAQIIARLKYPEPEAASPKRHQQIRTRILHILKLTAGDVT